jgi:hypothetical protein
MQFIHPNDANMVQNAPRTTSHASKPPSGKSLGYGPAGGAATSSGAEGGGNGICPSEDLGVLSDFSPGFSSGVNMVMDVAIDVMFVIFERNSSDGRWKRKLK